MVPTGSLLKTSEKKPGPPEDHILCKSCKKSFSNEGTRFYDPIKMTLGEPIRNRLKNFPMILPQFHFSNLGIFTIFFRPIFKLLCDNSRNFFWQFSTIRGSFKLNYPTVSLIGHEARDGRLERGQAWKWVTPNLWPK